VSLAIDQIGEAYSMIGRTQHKETEYKEPSTKSLQIYEKKILTMNKRKTRQEHMSA
jgi:hypothetical protein